MQDDDYTDIGPAKVKYVTDKAVLLKLKTGGFWVPRSQLLESDWKFGDELDECFVKTWLAEKEIL